MQIVTLNGDKEPWTKIQRAVHASEGSRISRAIFSRGKKRFYYDEEGNKIRIPSRKKVFITGNPVNFRNGGFSILHEEII